MWDQLENRVERRPKPGILRLDISKPRRSSGGSVEFKMQPELLGEVPTSTSPSPTGATSPPQLSVTWASVGYGEELDPRIDSNRTRMSQMHSQLKASLDIVKKQQSFEEPGPEAYTEPTTPREGENSEDDDYSVSVSAIMQRRASFRGHRKKSFRSPRRASSPMDTIISSGTTGDRRRSSVYTTSSGERIFSTAVSIEEGPNQDSSQEQILENIRLHKEVLQSVKYQPWSMRRKLKLVRQAKEYIAKHQGVLQERFAMTRSTSDLWARFKIAMAARCQYWRRGMKDVAAVLIPWELQIKEIESHFGSVVASYFTFLRWLLWVNIVITTLLSAFVIVPEWMGRHPHIKDERKTPLKGELKIAGNFMTIWEFNGFLKYSPLFYGYYSNFSGAIRWGYNLPLAYFLTSLVVYIYSFVATLRKMAENSRSSKLSSKDDECVFSWKLFTAWDYMIGHAETAHNRIASIVLGFKEALLEEAEKKKDKRNWKVILIRIIVNLFVLALLAASAYTIIIVVDRSENVEDNESWWRRNEITIVINVISLVLPMVFEVLGLLESFHPREQLRLQLARIMILNLLNLYSMIFALFFKITEKTDRLEELRQTITNTTMEKRLLQYALREFDSSTSTPSSPAAMNLVQKMAEQKNIENITAASGFYKDFTTLSAETATRCFTIIVNCSKSRDSNNSLLTTSLLLLSLSTTMLPEWQNFSESEATSPFSVETTDQFASTTLATTDIESYDYYEYGDNETNYYDSDREAIRRQERAAAPSIDQIKNQLLDVYLKFAENAGGKSTTGLNARGSTKKGSPVADTGPTTTIPFENGTRFPEINTTTKDTFYEDFIDNGTSEVTNADSTTFEATTYETYPDYYQYTDENLENCTEIVCVPWEDTTTEFEDFSFSTEDDTTSTKRKKPKPTIKQTTYSKTTTAATITSTDLTTTTISRDSIKAALNNATKKLKNARKILTGLCWETMLGQEMAKILVTDLVTVIGMSLLQDFFRALFVRYMNRCWIWDLEKKFPKYGDFKVAENVLQLVCNQGQVWMGLFFSPGLSVLNLGKLIILLYVRLWIIFTCNVPHEVVFKATRSNNFYLSLLLTMLFLCVLPVGYAIVWLTPSWHCGPFSGFSRISEFFTNTTRNALPKTLHRPLEYITSSCTVIPLLLLLILIIYYLVSLTSALRDANQDLREQLQKERSEERKRMCRINDEKVVENTTTIAARWRKALDASSPLSPTAPTVQPEESKAHDRKEFLNRIMKKALRKESATSDEESAAQNQDNDDDETDTEHPDALPHDGEQSRQRKHTKSSSDPYRRIRKPSLIDIVEMVRRDSVNEPHPIERFRVDRNVVDGGTENDPDLNSKIVAERRKSLLKRQRQFHRTDSTTLPEKDDAVVSFEVVNEKNDDGNRRSKSKNDPEVFKFDKKGAAKRQVESPSKDTIKRRPKSHSGMKEDPEVLDPPDKPVVEQPKGRRKLGSFLALVKDAVNAKRLEAEKQDPCDTPDIPSPFSTFEEPIEESIRVIAEENQPIGSSESQSGSTSTSSKTKKEAGTKRQDSQGSVWSENIPVITISKSGSDECILECSDKEADLVKEKHSEKEEESKK